jgi:hypothetical protein
VTPTQIVRFMSSGASRFFACAPLAEGIEASDSEAERARRDAAEAVVAAELANEEGSDARI